MRHATLLLTAVLLAGGLCTARAQTQPGTQAAPAAASAAAATEGPTEVVQTAAQGILGELDHDRAMYRRDPAKLADLVNKYLLPHFDTELSARLVLGQYWRTATPEQRKRFVDAFYHSLLANYGEALVDFTADRLKIFPGKVDPDASRATVRTEVTRSNGDRVSVNYYLHRTPEGWKAWDVVIDGISYVNSYREDFGPQIESQGIDSVIKRLESGEKPNAIGKQANGEELVSAQDAAAPPPAGTGAFALAPAADGRLVAQGPLSFATARQARQLGVRAIAAAEGPLEIDCGAVSACDSAGLAVLLDWLAVARARGRSLRLVRLPEGVSALARISEVDQLLARGV